MSPISKVLDAFGEARTCGAGRYLVCCRAHNDRSPSVSIRELDDGRILLKCWAGCDTANVLAAVGLTFSDLFPTRNDTYRTVRPGERWVPRDVLAAVADDALDVVYAAQWLLSGRSLSELELQWLAERAGRLRAAARAAGCTNV